MSSITSPFNFIQVDYNIQISRRGLAQGYLFLSSFAFNQYNLNMPRLTIKNKTQSEIASDKTHEDHYN